MSNAPYMLPKARFGYRLGDGKVVDHMVFDGLTDIYSGQHMGNTGEIVAERYNVSREDADALAARSHQRAAQATEEGRFKDEIVPVEVSAREGNTLVETDEGIRAGTTAAGLAKLRPVFQEDGIVTAGNASQISDGGSAVVVMAAATAAERGIAPLATVRGYDASGVKPEWVMEAPIPSVRNLFKRTGATIDDVDLFEHNEAFASASCAVRAELKVPDDKFNVHGGAVALGHPIGASGTRVLTTLLYALRTHKKDTGVATLCLGGGNAVSMLVERV
jgi:acetyl-CoA C-acetyltransferase